MGRIGSRQTELNTWAWVRFRPSSGSLCLCVLSSSSSLSLSSSVVMFIIVSTIKNHHRNMNVNCDNFRLYLDDRNMYRLSQETVYLACCRTNPVKCCQTNPHLACQTNPQFEEAPLWSKIGPWKVQNITWEDPKSGQDTLAQNSQLPVDWGAVKQKAFSEIVNVFFHHMSHVDDGDRWVRYVFTP